MLKIVVVTVLLIVSAVTLFKPWVGAIFYVVFSIWAPQTIWYWGFGDIRVAYIMSIVICGSFVVHLSSGRISLSYWKSKTNALVVFFWITIVCSLYFGGLPPNNLIESNLNSYALMSRYNNILIMFFLLQPLIYDISILSRLIWAFVFVFGFYIYWGNVQYFSGEMFQRGITLTGPTLAHGTGNYTDGNLLAMLFVMAVPFIFFLGEGSKNKITKYFMYLMIPFAWHAVFLTGSRGGLVGLLVVSLYMIYRTPKKVLAVLLAGGMLVALVYQGGDIMKQRSQKIIKYENDASALQRIESWKLASVICMDNPFFGVGLGNFTLAWENYSDSDPRVAHNTFLQVAVENGIIACLLLLCIAINVAMDLHKVRLVATEKYCSDSQKVKHIGSMANALEGACLGFFVCGLFLNLGLYEIFYVFLMMIVLLKRHIVTTNID